MAAVGSSWFGVDVGHYHLMVQGGHGSLSLHSLKCTWVSVTSGFEMGCWPLAEAGEVGIAVTSWSEVSQCLLSEVGQMWVSVTSWSKVGMGQCHLMI